LEMTPCTPDLIAGSSFEEKFRDLPAPFWFRVIAPSREMKVLRLLIKLKAYMSRMSWLQ
jgi:hypothetical protein